MEQGKHSLTLLCRLWEREQRWDPCSELHEQLQNAVGRAGTAGPHPAQHCHGVGIRWEASKAQEQAGREEDAVRRTKPVTTYEGHVLREPGGTRG